MPDKELTDLIEAIEKCSRELRKIVDSVQVYPRKIPELDQVLLALLNRALNTLNSVILLVREERGADATVLSRVVIEIWIVVRWITNKEELLRAQRFAYYSNKMVERTVSMMKHHDPHAVIPPSLETAEIAEAADQYSSHIHWAGSVKMMAEEPEELDQTLTMMLYYYEVPYFMSSWYVHSNVMGVREVVPEWGVPFTLKSDRVPSLCHMALVMATNCAVLTTIRVGHTLKLEISEKAQTSWNNCVIPLITP
jgi:hypothetical protein